MADEFRIAGAYVEVNLRDNTQADEAKIRARIEGEKPIDWDTALKSPDNAQEIRRMMGAEPPIDLGTRLKAAGNEREIAAEAKAAIGTIEPEVKPKVDDTASAAAGAKAAEETDAAYRAKSSEKGQSSGRALAAAIAAGVVLGSPLIGAAVVGASAAAFGALGVAAAAQTQPVKDAFADLAQDARARFSALGQTLQGEVRGDIDQLRGSFNQLFPEIEQGVQRAMPLLSTLVSGVTSFAGNALPGMDHAITNAGPIFVGFDNLLAETGTGVGNLFDSVATHSTGMGASLTAFGHVADDVLTGVGSIIGTLSTVTGSHAADIENIFHQISTGADQLVTSLGPALGGGITALSNALTGLNSELAPLEGGIQAFGSSLGALAVTWLIGNKLSGPIGTLGDGLQKLGSKAAGVSNSLIGTGASIGSLGTAVSKSAGIIGLALPLLSEFEGWLESTTKSGATGASTELVQGLGDALAKTGGQASAAAGQLLENSLRTTQLGGDYKDASTGMNNFGDAAKAAGSSVADTTAAIQGSDAQYQQWHDHLDQVANSIQNTVRMGGDVTNSQLNQAAAITALLPQTDKLHQAYDQAANSAANAAYGVNSAQNALRQLVTTTQTSINPTESMKAAVAGLGDSSVDTGKKITLLGTAMQQLLQPFQSADDALAGFYTDLTNVASQVSGVSGKVFDLGGNLDLTSQKGAAVHSALEKAVGDMEKYGEQAFATGVPVNQMNSRLNDMRQKLIDTIAPLVGSHDKAVALANAYLGVPGLLSTIIQTPGMALALQQVPELRQKVIDVPNDKTVHTQALTAAAVATLQNLGFTVRTLPDHTVMIYANAADAYGTLTNFVRTVNGTTAVVHIKASPVGTDTIYSPGGVRGYAEGGIVPNATGNMWSTWPSDTASLFQPGQLNLIGDARVPESFIPWDSSPRSTRLLAATNAGMGDPLGVQRPTEQTVTHNYYITVKDNATAYEVAAMVSAEQDYALRAMA